MEKAQMLRQPSLPKSIGDAKSTKGMETKGRKQVIRTPMPPQGAFSAQMLRPPSTPTFPTDSPLEHFRPEDEEFSSEKYDFTFVTSRERSEAGNQALSPPPPPPPRHLNSRRPATRPVLRTVGAMKSKVLSPQIQAVKSISDDQLSNQSSEKPTPSVHPIDTLSKKLRQQAMELTHVYEELEKQNVQLDGYKQQIKDQKLQLEQLRTQRRKSMDGSLKTPKSSRTTALNQQKRSTQMMIGTPCTGKSLHQKRGELENKVKEAEKEKKKYELAAKRIEKALVELQVFQNDRMGKSVPSTEGLNQGDDSDTSSDLETLFNEQRAYIRVLEEAIHLKATDFEVTGHEELLVVLAELRHTIYEQEKDVEQKSVLLSSIQKQLERETQEHLTTKDLLLNAKKEQEEMTRSFQEQQSQLHIQLETVVKQLQQRDNHLLHLEGVATSAKRAEEAQQNRLAAATNTQNLMESKLEDAARNFNSLQEKLDTILTKYEEAKQQKESLQVDCAKKQSHLDELNVLQEELLGSVDKYVGKAKKARDKVERLEVELQTYKDQESLVQKQMVDTARSTDEIVAALQAEINAAESQIQELQTHSADLLTEKKILENTLVEVQTSLETQIQENSEQQEEIAAKERKCHHVEGGIAELEAALSTALIMMLNKPVEISERLQIPDNDNDADENAFLLDHFVLQELQTCCLALNTLTIDTSVCPSFPEIITRMSAISERVQIEISRALSSWTRERTNLLEACSLLDSTAQMCQDEMTKRHVEIRDYREQLMERSFEVEAYLMQVETLDDKLRHAKAECESFHELEEHVADQEKALNAKQLMIQTLSAENDRLAAMENVYSVQVATTARNSQQLEEKQEAMKEQRKYTQELETALENAATFAEQQNECNQQLSVQIAQLESCKREQSGSIETLEEQKSTFLSRFLALIQHYSSLLRPIAATDCSLQDLVNLLDTEVQNGDVLRLLQLFPGIVEEYISTISRKDLPSRHRKRKDCTPTCRSPVQDSSPLKIAPMRSSSGTQNEEEQLAEQLQFIRGAFQSYKDNLTYSG